MNRQYQKPQLKVVMVDHLILLDSSPIPPNASPIDDDFYGDDFS